MGCGESKQKGKDGGDDSPENTVDNSADDQVPDRKEKLEIRDLVDEGVVDRLEAIRNANLATFVGEFTLMAGKIGGLAKRQDGCQKKCNKERKDMAAFLGRIRDGLQTSDLSIEEMGNFGMTLEKSPDKFQGLLVELSKLDVELQSLSDFRFKGLDGRSVGMFDMPEELRDALEDLTTEANELLSKSRTIRFGILEMLREIDTAKWYIALNMVKTHQRGHLEMEKNNLEKEVGNLKKEKERLAEERDRSKAVKNELEKVNVKLQEENQNLKESNQELNQVKIRLEKENEQLKATMLDMMLMKMDADKHPTYPKEPDLRLEPPRDDDAAVLSNHHEPDLLPEPQTDLGPYHPVISFGEASIEKSSLIMAEAPMEKITKRLNVGRPPDNSLAETIHTEKFDFLKVRNYPMKNVLPSALSTDGVQAQSKCDPDGQLPTQLISQAQPPSDVKCVSSGVKLPDEKLSEVVYFGRSMDVEDSNGLASKVGISKELATAVRISKGRDRASDIGNLKTRKSRMPSPSFPSSDFGILKVLAAPSRELELTTAEDRASIGNLNTPNSKVKRSEIPAEKDPAASDAKIPDQKPVQNCVQVQDLRLSHAERSQVPVLEVQDAEEIEIQRKNAPGATNNQRRRKKTKKKEPGLFKVLFKGLICTRRSAHD